MAKPRDDFLPTRVSLLQRLKDKDDHASWQRFFDTYWKLIYGVARKAGLSDQEAQDVVQETMASVAQHIPKFDYDPALGSFKAWLLNNTRWCISRQFRKRLPVHNPPPTPEETTTGFVERVADPATENVTAMWEAEWERNLADVATAHVKRRIDPRKFQMFDCYVNQQWPAEKVAAQFKVSVDQVYQARHRVIEAIRQEVERLNKDRI